MRGLCREGPTKSALALYGTLLSPSGERLDGAFTIAQTDKQVSNVRVVFDGTSYLVLWQDNLTTYGKWVSRNGDPFDQDKLNIWLISSRK